MAPRSPDRSEFVARLRANFDASIKSDFKLAISHTLDFGVRSHELADAFAVSPATISRWRNGTVVPGLLVRQVTVDRIAGLLLAEDRRNDE